MSDQDDTQQAPTEPPPVPQSTPEPSPEPPAEQPAPTTPDPLPVEPVLEQAQPVPQIESPAPVIEQPAIPSPPIPGALVVQGEVPVAVIPEQVSPPEPVVVRTPQISETVQEPPTLGFQQSAIASPPETAGSPDTKEAPVIASEPLPGASAPAPEIAPTSNSMEPVPNPKQTTPILVTGSPVEVPVVQPAPPVEQPNETVVVPAPEAGSPRVETVEAPVEVVPASSEAVAPAPIIDVDIPLAVVPSAPDPVVPTQAQAAETQPETVQEEPSLQAVAMPVAVIAAAPSVAEVVEIPPEVPIPATVPAPVVEVAVGHEAAPLERSPLSPIAEVSSSTERPASEVTTQREVVSAPSSPASVVIIEPIEHHPEVTPLPSPMASEIAPRNVPESPELEESKLQLPPPVVEPLPVEQTVPPVETVQPAEVTVVPQSEAPVLTGPPPAEQRLIDEPSIVTIPQAINPETAAQATVEHTEVVPELVKPVEQKTAEQTPAPKASERHEVPPVPTIILTKAETEPPKSPTVKPSMPDTPGKLPRFQFQTSSNPYDDPNLGPPITEIAVGEKPINAKVQFAGVAGSPADKPPRARFRDRFMKKVDGMGSHFKSEPSAKSKVQQEAPRKRDRARVKIWSEDFLSFALGRRHAVVVKSLLEHASKRPRKDQQEWNQPKNIARTRTHMKNRGNRRRKRRSRSHDVSLGFKMDGASHSKSFAERDDIYAGYVHRRKRDRLVDRFRRIFSPHDKANFEGVRTRDQMKQARGENPEHSQCPETNIEPNAEKRSEESRPSSINSRRSSLVYSYYSLDSGPRYMGLRGIYM